MGVLIITGGKGAGKSTNLLRVLPCLREAGFKVAGVISRGFWRDGVRQGYEAVDAATGEALPLAFKAAEVALGIEAAPKASRNEVKGWSVSETAESPTPPPAAGERPNLKRYCAYNFYIDTFSEFNRRLARDAESADVMILDEAGNIEIKGLEAGGWDVDAALRCRAALLSVREDLVQAAREKWNLHDARIIRVARDEDVSNALFDFVNKSLTGVSYVKSC